MNAKIFPIFEDLNSRHLTLRITLKATGDLNINRFFNFIKVTGLTSYSIHLKKKSRPACKYQSNLYHNVKVSN